MTSLEIISDTTEPGGYSNRPSAHNPIPTASHACVSDRRWMSGKPSVRHAFLPMISCTRRAATAFGNCPFHPEVVTGMNSLGYNRPAIAPHRNVSRWRSPVRHPMLLVAAAWYSVNSATVLVRWSQRATSPSAICCALSHHSPLPALSTPIAHGCLNGLYQRAQPVPVSPGSTERRDGFTISTSPIRYLLLVVSLQAWPL